MYIASKQNQKKTTHWNLFTSCWSEKWTMNINLMRSGNQKKTACFPKYTLDYQHKNCSDKPVIRTTLFKRLLGFFFFPLCDYLFICLLIYFSTPWVQRAEDVWCALMAVFTKGGKGKAAAAFRSKGGERDMSACLRRHYKSFRLILWGDEEKRIWKKKKM